MYYTIYKTTNQLDNKFYIGKHQTKDLEDGYYGSGKRLHRAIKKHGIENFKKEILFIFDNEIDMNNKEKEIVTVEFCKRKDVYNLCEGGRGGFGYINQEQLNNKTGANLKGAAKLQQNLKDADFNKKFRENISQGLMRLSKEKRKEISKLGNAAFKKKYKNGFKHSEETKKRISEKMKIVRRPQLQK